MHKVMNAWHHGRPARAGQHWTDGVSVYSYSTAILTPVDPDQGGAAPFVFNATKYSPTTSRHQNATRRDVPSAGLVTLTDVPRNASANTLRALAAEAVR